MIRAAKNSCCLEKFEALPKPSRDQCEYKGVLGGVAAGHTAKFAYDESYWLKSYVEAWHRATENSIMWADSAVSKKYFSEHVDPKHPSACAIEPNRFGPARP